MIDFAALKHVYPREIADFRGRTGPRPGPRKASSLIHNGAAFKCRARTSGMMDAISVIKDRFREAGLPESTPFRLNIALAEFDMKLTIRRRLRRGFPDVTGNIAGGAPFSRN